MTFFDILNVSPFSAFYFIYINEIKLNFNVKNLKSKAKATFTFNDKFEMLRIGISHVPMLSWET